MLFSIVFSSNSSSSLGSFSGSFSGSDSGLLSNPVELLLASELFEFEILNK